VRGLKLRCAFQVYFDFCECSARVIEELLSLPRAPFCLLKKARQLRKKLASQAHVTPLSVKIRSATYLL